MIKAIITDIEGTTSALSFVKDELFPYARANLRSFVEQHREEPVIAAILDDAREAAETQGKGSQDIVDTLIEWIDQDQKVTPLKALQGHIWKTGYANGDFFGHVYDDAHAQLKTWHDQGINLYVYSSGSVGAQKLLFANTKFGDLTPWFSGYFDTNIGGKKETDSYIAIAKDIGHAPSDLLFLSDIDEELIAAKQAGYQVVQLIRENQPPLAGIATATNFTEISLP